jgi:glutamine synthetase
MTSKEVTRPIILEYIWIDGKNGFRSKYKTTNFSDIKLSIEQWTYDGRECYYTDNTSEITLNPVIYCNNPFFEKGSSLLVLCDTVTKLGDKFVSIANNKRPLAVDTMNKWIEHEPIISFTQEYFIVDKNGCPPFFSGGGLPPKTQGDYYCGVGHNNMMYRELAETHYKHCISASLKIISMNAGSAPNQWRFRIGIGNILEICDQLLLAKYILIRVAETYNLSISFEPRPLPEPWNSSGLYISLSSKESRNENGIDKLNMYIERLLNRHTDHINLFGGEGNNNNKFTWGIGTYNTSIRIPGSVSLNRRGYLEDRRACSNVDPYLIASKICDTCFTT